MRAKDRLMTIKLWNTATRSKDVFTPIDPDHVRMYVCGPTVYDRAHLGNARSAVVFDVLQRVLRHVYPRVTYARNITDVDDKINARAAETGRPIAEITEETVGWYRDDMGALGVQAPDAEPRATQYIDQMIAMSADLIAKGHAYAAEGHVLFRVRSYEKYGALSGRSVDDMIAGARVEVAPFKEDPMDFVLWKPAGDGPGWESPWGRGRPGWHIECSAMAQEILGETFDIHGGGLDLQFPHHENEIAQSICAHGAPMANYWLHNEMLQVEGKKMSKSLGNFFTVRELLESGYPGEVIRFVLMSTQYSKPMDWTKQKAAEAEATLRKWRGIMANVPQVDEVSAKVFKPLANDLNTPGAITALHKIAAHEPEVLRASAGLMGLLGDELGGWDKADQEVSALIEALLVERVQARTSKDFARADEIRDAFNAAGVEVRDGADGAEWSLKPGFDASKLGGLS